MSQILCRERFGPVTLVYVLLFVHVLLTHHRGQGLLLSRFMCFYLWMYYLYITEVKVCLLSRATAKAVEAAIGSRQWAKAVQILELQDTDMASRYYKKIGDHYASIGEYEVLCGDEK